MKKLLITLLLCLCPVAAMAAPGWNRDITVEWGYEPPTDLVLIGFKLYQEGIVACDLPGTEARTASCGVVLSKRSTPFTMTAVFQNGEESPHSEAYVVNDWGPKPKIIRFIINW